MWIAFSNIVITVTFQLLGKIKRGKNSSENYESVTFNIFVCQFLNTGVLLLLVFNSF